MGNLYIEKERCSHKKEKEKERCYINHYSKKEKKKSIRPLLESEVNLGC